MDGVSAAVVKLREKGNATAVIASVETTVQEIRGRALKTLESALEEAKDSTAASTELFEAAGEAAGARGRHSQRQLVCGASGGGSLSGLRLRG